MSRRGRKRKEGPRDKSGRLNVRKLSMDQIMAMQPHRRVLPPQHRLSAKATTSLGVLNLTGRITDEQYDAGIAFTATVNAYRAVIGSIDPLMAPAPGYGGDISAAEARRRTDVYNSMFEALWRAGQRAAKTVSRVAVYDEPCSFADVQYLRLGLDALVEMGRRARPRQAAMAYDAHARI